MRRVSIPRFLCFVICFNWAASSSVYNMKCNHSSECTVYPNITQGPDVIWIPFFCNENNFCACPNGWIPLAKDDVCITQVTGSSAGPSAPYIPAISGFLVIILLALIR